MRDAAVETDDNTKEEGEHNVKEDGDDLDRRSRWSKYYGRYLRGQRWVRNTRLGKWYANSPNAQRAVSLGLLGASLANPVVGGARAGYLAARYGIPLIRNGARAYRRFRYVPCDKLSIILLTI